MGQVHQYSIKQIAEALFQSTGILLSFSGAEERRLAPLAETDIDVQVLSADLEFAKTFRKQVAVNRSRFLFNVLNCGWMLIVREGGEGIYAAGPVLMEEISDSVIIQNYRRLGLRTEKIERLTELYHKMPVISFSQFCRICDFICQLFIGEGLNAVLEVAQDGEAASYPSVKRRGEDYYRGQQRNFQTSLKAERYMLDCVKTGAVEQLKMVDKSAEHELTSLGTNELRSMKNNLITAITLITRAAMEGGLAVEIAFPLSDAYIIQIEKAGSVTKAFQVFQQVKIDFATRVRNNQFKVQYSRKINQCCSFIRANFYMPLKLTDVAETAGLHPDYLSRLFKKETGISVSDYIRRVRTEEAKRLLGYTEEKLTDIAFELGYSGQGKFTEDFKRETKMTPGQYRKKACETNVVPG